MGDSSQYALRYSHYSLNIGGIPREFELSESLRQLSTSSIDKHDVSREHEVRLWLLHLAVMIFNLSS
jgi:hypothetical protein